MTLSIQLISDTHLEHHKDSGFGFLESLPVAADVLVVAGDFTSLRFFSEARRQFEVLCHNRRRVYFVPGNHEYYNMTPDEAESTLRALEAELPVLRVLCPGRVEELDGHRILGATLWYKDDPMNTVFGLTFPDFEYIKGLVPWVYEQNRAAIRFFTEELREGDIVVTHHAPSWKSLDGRYDGHVHNRFFACDIEDMIRVVQPALWMHGHLHRSRDYLIEKCRIASNPFGYPTEPDILNKFHEKLVLEI